MVTLRCAADAVDWFLRNGPVEAECARGTALLRTSVCAEAVEFFRTSSRVCSRSGCGGRVLGRGLCRKHYSAEYRAKRVKPSVAERGKVDHLHENLMLLNERIAEMHKTLERVVGLKSRMEWRELIRAKESERRCLAKELQDAISTGNKRFYYLPAGVHRERISGSREV